MWYKEKSLHFYKSRTARAVFFCMNDEQRQTDTRELLIRLDERLKGMQATLVQIQGTIANKVENDQEYKELKIRVDNIWDFKNKLLGYTAAIAFIISFAVDYVRGMFVK